jgi:hypothetical protein
MSDSREWFAPKRYGYGTGLPIAWQGWVVLVGFILIVLVLAVALERRPRQLVAALIPVTTIFLLICARTTRGGWHWRWGNDD